MLSKKDKKTMTLGDVDMRLSKLRIPSSMVTTPVNLTEEREKFLNSEEYNPVFKYKIVKNSNDAIFEELLKIDAIEGVDPRISQFYIELIEDKKLAHDLMCSVGNNELFTDLSSQKFKAPTPILYRNACRVMRGNYKNYNVVNTTSLKKTEYLDYNSIRDVFLCVFNEFGLTEWNVNTSKNIRKGGVKTGIKSREIFIDPNIQKAAFDVKKTVIHELTHILRAYNGENSGFKAFAKPNINSYLDIEEGLAMWNEEHMGYLKDVDLKERASVVHAIHLGKEKSFRQLYNVMFGIYSKNKAFYITYLAKRGMGDTSLPGVYTKSAAYFRGFRKVRKELALDASLYEKLFAGKISLKHVKWVEEGLIREARIVPTKKNFEDAFRKADI
jgi:hypothetical protein